jgi:hypothetical protein
MVRKKNVARIMDEMTRLQSQLDEVRQHEAGRLGDLAVKAGLSDLDISDRDLLTAFKEIAARFQNQPANG